MPIHPASTSLTLVHERSISPQSASMPMENKQLTELKRLEDKAKQKTVEVRRYDADKTAGKTLEERTARLSKQRKEDETNRMEQIRQAELEMTRKEGEATQREMEERKRSAENAKMKANAKQLVETRFQEKRRTSASSELLSNALVASGVGSKNIAKVTSLNDYIVVFTTMPLTLSFVHTR
jgi:hypothetical protein